MPPRSRLHGRLRPALLVKRWSIRKTNDRAVNREQTCNGLTPRFRFGAVQEGEPFGFEFSRTSGYCRGVLDLELETDLRNRVLPRPRRCAEACLRCLVQRPDPEVLLPSSSSVAKYSPSLRSSGRPSVSTYSFLLACGSTLMTLTLVINFTCMIVSSRFQKLILTGALPREPLGQLFAMRFRHLTPR